MRNPMSKPRCRWTAFKLGHFPKTIVTCFVLGLVMLIATWGTVVADEKPTKLDTNPDLIRDVVQLKKSDVDESSGLAVSNVARKRWWTHNDSGDKSRLYSVDERGKATGRCQLKGVKAEDWEDMASFVQDGRPRLLVADSGDNEGKRKSILIHLFDEPDPDDSTDVKKVQTLEIRFPDRPHDCEAVAVDPVQAKILLVTKAKLPYAIAYEVDLPKRDPRPSKKQKPSKVTASRVGSLTLSMISAMDRDPVNGDLWIATYFQAYHFKRVDPNENFAEQLARLPTVIDLPRWRQVEAIAVDQQHQVWITSEGKSPPMGRLNRDRN